MSGKRPSVIRQVGQRRDLGQITDNADNRLRTALQLEDQLK